MWSAFVLLAACGCPEEVEAEPPTGCEIWPVWEGEGDTWTWDTADDGCADCTEYRQETRLGAEDFDGVSAWKLEVDAGMVGYKGGSDRHSLLWLRCEGDAMQVVAEDRTDTEYGEHQAVLDEQHQVIVYDPPLPLFPPLLSEGATQWATVTATSARDDGSQLIEDVEIDVTVIGVETVDTDAGSFEAVHIEGLPDFLVHGDDSWWAAPHGLIADAWLELNAVP